MPFGRGEGELWKDCENIVLYKKIKVPGSDTLIMLRIKEYYFRAACTASLGTISSLNT